MYKMINTDIDFAFIDSGTGGIPYMLNLKKKLPQARCVYLGDTAHFPYGEKTMDEVTECASRTIKLIVEKWNPKVLIIACNTISVTSLAPLRKRFPSLSIVGTVPAIKLAANVSKNKVIGLLATNATVKHPYCQNLIDDFASDCKVFSRGDPELISFIEHKLFTATEDEKNQAVLPSVSYFKSCGCDTIILGCTHFTHIANILSNVCGDEIQIVDSRDGVSNQAIRIMNSDINYKHVDLKEELPEDMTFFVTKCETEKDETEYSVLCKNFNIPWGGLLK